VLKIINGNTYLPRRPKGRPRLRWEDDARNDLRKMGVKNWKQKGAREETMERNN
jgi:hypothetical protein